jgi:hypothetical protein
MTDLKFKNYSVKRLEKLLNPDNPRWIPEAEFQSLQSSLTEFSCVEPVIVNLKTKQVVGGHQRIAAAIAKGIDTLPVVEINIDKTKEIAFNLVLNKISGDWDYGKLAEVLQSIKEADKLDFTGFNDTEVDVIIGEQNKAINLLNQSLINKEDDHREEEEEREDESFYEGAKGENSQGNRENYKEDKEDFGGGFDATDEINNDSDDDSDENIKISFGMFSRYFSKKTYQKWIDNLKGFDENIPVSIANRLGIKLNS